MSQRRSSCFVLLALAALALAACNAIPINIPHNDGGGQRSDLSYHSPLDAGAQDASDHAPDAALDLVPLPILEGGVDGGGGDGGPEGGLTEAGVEAGATEGGVPDAGAPQDAQPSPEM